MRRTAGAVAYTSVETMQKFIRAFHNHPQRFLAEGFVRSQLKISGSEWRSLRKSLKVLGIIDDAGEVTDLGWGLAPGSKRAEAVIEALRHAYPDILRDCIDAGGELPADLTRRLEAAYGATPRSAARAARLIRSLVREHLSPNISEDERGEQDRPAPSLLITGATANDGHETVTFHIHIHVSAETDRCTLDHLFDRIEQLARHRGRADHH